MDWLAWRERFAILERRTYLNTCSLGPLSDRHREAHAAFFEQWDDLGAAAWYGPWAEVVEALRGKVARLLHADRDEVALLPNVTSALASISSCLPKDRQCVATSTMDFPTVPQHFLRKPTMDVRFIEADDGLVDVPWDRYAFAMEAEADVFAFSQVLYLSGAVQPVADLARLARKAGALALCDGYQGAGQLPTDPRALGLDVYLTGGLKWLLGGTGIAFLWVRRELHEQFTPTVTGWFGSARQFDFDPKAFQPWPDARRFEAGTPALHAVAMAHAGLDIVLEIGPERIRDRTRHLGMDLVDRLKERDFTLKSPLEPDKRAGIVAVEWPGGGEREAAARLVRQGIIVDARPGRIRASPYFYNTEEDNQRFVDALAAARSAA